MAAQPLELPGGFGEAQLEVHPLLGAQVIRTEHLARDAAEALPELVEPLAPDGESRGHLVPAVALEQITAGEQRRVEVESRDAPAGSLADVAVEGNQERRPAIPLDHPGGHDAHHAGMPAVAREHEGRVALGVACLLDLGNRLLENPVVERLPLHIHPLQPAGQLERLGGVVAQQQAKAVGRVADPAGRVESRAQHVPQVTRANLPPGETGGLDQRPQSRPPALREQANPVAHEDAVLAGEGHDIGHRREGDQIEQVIGQIRRQPERGHERLYQLEGDAGAAERSGIRRVVGALRIHDGDGRRQLGSGQVVVGNDHADPGGPGVADRVDRRDPAVAGDDERRAEPSGRREPGGPKSYPSRSRCGTKPTTSAPAAWSARVSRAVAHWPSTS